MSIPLLITAFLVGVAGPAPSPPIQDRDAALRGALDAWVAMWNSYDLDEVRRLFVVDGSVTHFSSETPGLIEGIAALEAHHRGFGFAPGGMETGSELWLESVEVRWEGTTALVLADWLFRGAGTEGPPQKGPVTFAYVWRDGGYRILHAHFANAPEEG